MTTDTSTRERTIDLPATAAAAAIARRELAATPGLAGELGYKALLMTSELIAVYVQDREPDPRRRLELAVRVTPERVRIEVGGPEPDVSPDDLLHSSETPSLGGMGLRIVDRMADAWGVQGEHDTSIWFELTR
ncbi:MAG TPA: ATP-binding protein [Solirubrobacteraceae bacterium]|nr:ATP-binding protein [Solirubrobacteraceae bacterium]